jgi:hypothetical protein
MLAVVVAVVLALEVRLVAHLQAVEQGLKELHLQLLELLILAVVVAVVGLLELLMEQVVLVAQALSSSLTQAHNNLVVAQSLQLVATLSIHSLLVVY